MIEIDYRSSERRELHGERPIACYHQRRSGARTHDSSVGGSQGVKLVQLHNQAKRYVSFCGFVGEEGAKELEKSAAVVFTQRRGQVRYLGRHIGCHNQPFNPIDHRDKKIEIRLGESARSLCARDLTGVDRAENVNKQEIRIDQNPRPTMPVEKSFRLLDHA
jgi:hypothetical protein